jgi:succinate dehydrogenase/fumarate reductase flavoprotein subunit
VRAPAGLVDLLFDARGRAAGVLAYDPDAQRWLVVRARAVILGTGGAHGLFSQQVSTSEMTGDGQAACWRAGAELVNMEFHQFGPALVHPYVQLFSKACFILHPRMLNAQGQEFLADYLPAGVRAADVYDEKVFPFTISNVSRYLDIAIAREIAAGRGTERGTVQFSFAHVASERIDRTMPNTARWMHERGVDLQRDLLDVGIAFQCLNGGVRMIDAGARTSLPGVHVIGELAGGVRGPDRPGGNSLAEGQVFGHRAGRAAAQDARSGSDPGPIASESVVHRLARALRPNTDIDLPHAIAGLQQSMQQHALVEKREEGLQSARRVAQDIETGLAQGGGATASSLQQVLTLENMATTAHIILHACQARRESRSGHYRTDFPERDDKRFGTAWSMRREGQAIAMHAIAYSDDERNP